MPDPLDILTFIAELLDELLSPAQETLLRAIYGLPLDADQLAIYKQLTNLDTPPARRQQDVTVVCGRRSGKTGRIGVNIGLYEALLGGHERHLGKAERGHVVIIAQSLKAVNETMALAKSKVSRSPDLAAEVLSERADELAFRNGMCLSIWPCTVKAVRGLHIPVAVCDEIGFWESEGANPDREVVYGAVRPAMATFPQRMLVKLSTPWAKAGVLWDDFQNWFGKPGGPLVWLAPTREMNPNVPVEFIVDEYARDPEKARREYDAVFSDPAEAFLPGEAVDSAVETGVLERRPSKERRYWAAVDVAFKTDATVLTIVHREGEDVVVDLWRGWKPQPGKPLVLGELARQVGLLCRLFGVRGVAGDQYASEPVREALRARGLYFSEVAFTATRAKRETADGRREVGATKGDIFGALKTLLVQGRLRLLDIKEGLRELKGLEVRRSFSGYETVGAPEGQHDDYAASLALAVWQAWRADERRERAGRVVQLGRSMLDAVVIEDDGLEAGLPEALRDSGPAEASRAARRLPWRGNQPSWP